MRCNRCLSAEIQYTSIQWREITVTYNDSSPYRNEQKISLVVNGSMNLMGKLYILTTKCFSIIYLGPTNMSSFEIAKCPTRFKHCAWRNLKMLCLCPTVIKFPYKLGTSFNRISRKLAKDHCYASISLDK